MVGVAPAPDCARHCYERRCDEDASIPLGNARRHLRERCARLQTANSTPTIEPDYGRTTSNICQGRGGRPKPKYNKELAVVSLFLV